MLHPNYFRLNYSAQNICDGFNKDEYACYTCNNHKCVCEHVIIKHYDCIVEEEKCECDCCLPKCECKCETKYECKCETKCHCECEIKYEKPKVNYINAFNPSLTPYTETDTFFNLPFLAFTVNKNWVLSFTSLVAPESGIYQISYAGTLNNTNVEGEQANVVFKLLKNNLDIVSSFLTVSVDGDFVSFSKTLIVNLKDGDVITLASSVIGPLEDPSTLTLTNLNIAIFYIN